MGTALPRPAADLGARDGAVGQRAASNGGSCPGHGCGACWGRAGAAGAGEAPKARAWRPSAQVGAPCQLRLRPRPRTPRLAPCESGTRAAPAWSRARGARWWGGARPSRERSARRRARARRRRGLRGAARELSLVLTTRRLGGPGSATSYRPGGAPPRPTQALRGSVALRLLSRELPVPQRWGFGGRPELWLLIHRATLGQVPHLGSFWFSF